MINPFIFDSISFFMLIFLIFELIFMIGVFIIYNLIYRNRKIFKRSLVILTILMLYNLILLLLINPVWTYLSNDYNPTYDILISFGYPLIIIGSISSLYLIFKRKKFVYLMIYFYIIGWLEYLMLILATSSNDYPYIPSKYGGNNSFIAITSSIIFITLYFISIINFFKELSDNENN